MTLQEERAVDPQMVSGVIAAGFRTLSFPAILEAHFESETGRERSRQLLLRGLAGIAFSLLYLAVDWTLTPDAFELALWVRLGIIPLVSFLVIALLWRNPRPLLRESAVGGLCVVVVLAPLAMMLISGNPLRDGHHVSVILVILFLTMLLRLRFPYAVVSCAAIFCAYAVAVTVQLDYPLERMFTNVLMFGIAVSIALIASYSLEHEFRLSYLLGLRERLRNADLVSLSLLDALTGLNNRRSLDESLARLEAARSGEFLATALFDIDHFKTYNDTLGHLAGDLCLKRVTALLQAELRVGTDMAFRFGGEEFLLLMPGADLATALGIADRIRHNIEAAAIPHPGRVPPGVVTVSAGVTAAPLGGAVSVQELIAGADSALYAAKRAGRNQVWPRLRRAAVVSDLSASREARTR